MSSRSAKDACRDEYREGVVVQQRPTQQHLSHRFDQERQPRSIEPRIFPTYLPTRTTTNENNACLRAHRTKMRARQRRPGKDVPDGRIVVIGASNQFPNFRLVSCRKGAYCEFTLPMSFLSKWTSHRHASSGSTKTCCVKCTLCEKSS